MGINNLIYNSEVIIAIIAIILGIIILKTKNKKRLLKFLGITAGVFVLVFCTTFIFEKPEIEELTENDLKIEVGSNKFVKKPKIKHHFKDVTDKVKINGDINYNKIGEYDIKFEMDTLTGTFSKPAKIKVIDTKSPKIELRGDEEFKQSYAKEYEDPGFSAFDEYEGDLTEKVITKKEDIDEQNYKIIYIVEDSSGNKIEKIRNIKIIDDVAPVITLNGDKNINLTPNSKYEEKGAKAQDEKDGDLTQEIKLEGNVDTSKEGTYTITYRVFDKSGNEAVAKRNIVVKKERQYVAPIKPQTGGTSGIIYLTFDDGPSTNITPKVLDILARKNVKATFFILNYNSAEEALVKREYNEGHTVAIHGYSHNYNEIYQSEAAYMANLTKLQDKIKASTGYTATITRFPGGSSNTVSKFNPGIMTRLCKLVRQKGFTYFDWNVSSGDAGGARNADDLYNNVIKGLSKSISNVVLMHDFSSNSKLLDALPRIIDYGIENGYTFSKITEKTPMVTHTPNN